MSKKGFIYIMSNKSMPGIIKIGMSTKVPEERAKELSSETSAPTAFVVEYYAFFEEMEKAEKQIHQKLKEFHFSKEFFKLNIPNAIACVESFDMSFTRLFSNPSHDAQAILLKKENERISTLKNFYEKKENIENMLLSIFETKNFDIFLIENVKEVYSELYDIFRQLQGCVNDYSAQLKEIMQLESKISQCVSRRKS